MSVNNGQPVNAAVTNAGFLSRLTDSDTVAKVGLKNTSDVNSGAIINNTQRAINKALDTVGATSESDATAKDYSSNNYITDGDNRKVAIEKLDTQLFTTQTDLDTAEAEIAGHEARLDTIETLASTFGGDKEFSNNVIIQGNLTVNGTQTVLNTATIDSEDPNITINKNGNDALSEGAGFTVDRTGTKGSLVYANALASKFKIGDLASEQEIVTVGHTQALTNKTLTDAEINALVSVEQGSTPSTPASGKRKIYSKADGFYQLDSTGLETKVGSGSGGGVVNLITNGSADDAVSSIFTPYADAAATRPVDGDGGSPTVTTSISAVNPLTGTKSYLLTKPASNTQGQGWAVSSFAMDQSYRTKSLKISVDYIVNSGSFVAGSNNGTPTDGDLIWYIYDITNSQLIEPSNIKMFSSNTTISDKFEATFQASVTGSSYRLIAHCASTSALAYEIKVDNVTVSPQVYVYGTPVTDWQEYTPTFTGLGSVSSTQMLWRRVGDSVEIAGRTTVGTSTATGVSFSLPGGVSVHSGFTNTQIVGYADRSAGASTYVKTWSLFSSANATTISLGNIDTNTSLDPLVAVIGTSVATTGQVLLFKADVKINGWSSSTQMSDSYAGRVIDFVGYVSTNQALTAAVTNLPLTVRKDSTSSWTGSTYVIPSSGDYLAAANLTYTTASTAELTVYKNGTPFRRIAAGTAHSIGQLSIGTATLEDLKVGDVISIRAQNFGVTVAADTIGFVSITKILGPQAFTANEQVNCRYTNTAGTSIANSGDIVVPFATKDFDTHGSFSVDTFTAQTAGQYKVDATIAFASSLYASGNQYYAVVYKNGAVHSFGPVNTITAALTVLVGTSVSAIVGCVAGDTIVVRASNTRTAGATALSTTTGINHLTIEKVG